MYVINGKIETQREKRTCSRSHIQLEAELGWSLRDPACRLLLSRFYNMRLGLCFSGYKMEIRTLWSCNTVYINAMYEKTML